MAALKAKIFVGGLPPSLTNEALRDFFNKWGPVRESQILVNRDTGRVRFIRSAASGTPRTKKPVLLC